MSDCSKRPKGHICVAENRGDNDAGGSHSEDYYINLTRILYANNISTVCRNIHEDIIPREDK